MHGTTSTPQRICSCGAQSIWSKSKPTLAVYPQESGHQPHLDQANCTWREHPKTEMTTNPVCLVVCVCIYTNHILLTLCPSAQHIWGFAFSRSRVHNSRSASPSDCLQRHTRTHVCFSFQPCEATETSTSPQDVETTTVSCLNSFIFTGRNVSLRVTVENPHLTY